MSTPEGKVKTRVKAVFKKHNVYYHMPVQNGMGAPSLDFVACHKGHFLAVETKAGSKQATPRQLETMKAIEAAGGKVFLVNEAAGLDDLDNWLNIVA